MIPGALAWATLGLTTAGWFGFIAAAMVREGDYQWHVAAAADLTSGVVRVPHLLFHLVVAALVVVGAAPPTAAVAATVLFQVAGAFTVAWFIRMAAPAAAPPVVALLALAVMLAGPMLPPGTDRDLAMVGYFLPNAIHNPTVIAAKPFVPLLLSLAAVASGATGVPGWTLARGALVTVLAALAKPHYVSCIVPAAAVFAVVRALVGRMVRWRLLVLGLCLPAVLALAATYAIVRAMPGDASVSIAPLAVLRLYVPTDPLAILQRTASDIAFPAFVILCWPAVVKRGPWLLLAWAAYGLALTQAYLLAETGPRLADGNFLWSPQLATFGLLASHAAVLPWMRPVDGRAPWRLVVAATLLGLHAIYGIWFVLGRVAGI
jgi:hypothetical protein